MGKLKIKERENRVLRGQGNGGTGKRETEEWGMEECGTGGTGERANGGMGNKGTGKWGNGGTLEWGNLEMGKRRNGG